MMPASVFSSSLFRFGVILIILTHSGCSTNDDAAPSEEKNNSIPFNITVFATASNGEIYQLDNLDDSENMEVTNLTETMGVPGEFKNVYISNTEAIFTNYQNTFWQKNVVTGSSLTRSVECELSDSENRYLFISGDVISLLSTSHTTTPEGTLEYENYLNIYNPSTAVCNRIYLNNSSILQQQSIKILKDRIFLYETEQGTSVNSLTVRSAETGEEVGKLTFDKEFRAILSDDRIYIKFFSGDYKEYNIDDLTLVKEGTTGNANLPDSPGVYRPAFYGSKMVFNFPYPQPAVLSTAPAIYDWSSNSMTHGGDFYLTDAFKSLRDEGFYNLSYQVVKVNLENNTIVVGYQDMQDQEKGGVVFLNFEGEVVSHVQLDFVPFEIMIRE